VTRGVEVGQYVAGNVTVGTLQLHLFCPVDCSHRCAA
jgi:hypothetical protein